MPVQSGSRAPPSPRRHLKTSNAAVLAVLLLAGNLFAAEAKSAGSPLTPVSSAVKPAGKSTAPGAYGADVTGRTPVSSEAAGRGAAGGSVAAAKSNGGEPRGVGTSQGADRGDGEQLRGSAGEAGIGRSVQQVKPIPMESSQGGGEHSGGGRHHDSCSGGDRGPRLRRRRYIPPTSPTMSPRRMEPRPPPPLMPTTRRPWFLDVPSTRRPDASMFFSPLTRRPRPRPTTTRRPRPTTTRRPRPTPSRRRRPTQRRRPPPQPAPKRTRPRKNLQRRI